MDRKRRAIILHFYPRSPCGERRVAILYLLSDAVYFYPRSPCGERQLVSMLNSPHSEISIHALLAESDCIINIINNIIDDFYPRSPCGERRRTATNRRPIFFISIHALLAESDLQRQLFEANSCISIHALLAESDNDAKH